MVIYGYVSDHSVCMLSLDNTQFLFVQWSLLVLIWNRISLGPLLGLNNNFAFLDLNSTGPLLDFNNAGPIQDLNRTSCHWT